MRIAHIVSTYPPYRGGMGNVAAAMVKELQQRGHECQVFTADYGGAYGSDALVTRLKPWFSLGNAAFLPQLSRALEQGRFDVIHLHYPFFGGAESVAYFKRRFPLVRFVITYHMDNIGKDWGRKIFFSSYEVGVLPLVMRQADVVTCSSLDYAMHSAIADLLPRLPIAELPFGVDAAFKPGERAAHDKVEFLFVGGLDQAHYFKGLHVLFLALHQLSPELRAKAHLRIVGAGELRSQYENQVKTLGLDGVVTFAGALEQNELINAYQQADLTILPSIDASEAFGLVLIESMACGTPVLASQLPGVRTIVEEGKSGWTVTPNAREELKQRLASVLAQPELLTPMRAAAAERVDAKYRWPAIMDQLEHLYKPA